MIASKVLERLRALGYALVPEEDSISYSWTGEGDPPEEAASLLQELVRCATEALHLLRLQIAGGLQDALQSRKPNGDAGFPQTIARLHGVEEPPSPPSAPPPSPPAVPPDRIIPALPVGGGGGPSLTRRGGITLALSLQPDGTCYCCKGSRWWLSVYGVLVCATCHPPAVPELVARYVDGGEAVRLAHA